MADPAVRAMTVGEFLEWESRQELRYEFLDGVVYAMVGGTVAHNVVTSHLAFALDKRLYGSGCTVMSQGMKVKIDQAVLYPDVLVACGPLDPSDRYLGDITLAAEILSPSTARRDREAKMAAYMALPSLRHYLLVSADEPSIELFTRVGDGWRPVTVTGLEAAVPLDALDLELPMADVYRGLTNP